MQINTYNLRKNSKIVDQEYKFRDKVILDSNADLKHETPYNGKFDIKQCCNNVTVTLQCGAIKIRCNIHHIEQYTSYINPEDIRR